MHSTSSGGSENTSASVAIGFVDVFVQIIVFGETVASISASTCRFKSVAITLSITISVSQSRKAVLKT